MKVAFFGVKSWEKETIEREINRLNAYGVGIYQQEAHEAVELVKGYDIISVFIYSQMNENILNQLPNLKYIATRSTGVDHIDKLCCEKKCVLVGSVPEYGTKTVAEYTMALMLAVTKKIVSAHQAVENDEFSPTGLTGIDLDGCTLGVVGVGKIGSQVVKYAKAFGMKVIAVDSKGDLNDLLSRSDIVTLHVPSIPSTHHLINKQNIKLMKKGSYLINTCRGAVVETSALVWALNKGILAGAGLDVVEEENLVEQVSVVTEKKITKESLQNLLSYHMLRDRDDVVFTPHNAFNTKQAIERIVKTTVNNINLFIDKK